MESCEYGMELFPPAMRGMVEIVRYISIELKNPIAANNTADELVEAAESIPAFPYANPAYIPIRPLKHEYRKLIVKNYIMLYWVDEEQKLVTVSRVVYARRDYDKILE
ncbi:MAG: type II toxin-antitoxin system RelE/ParE family toxin [Oscillospiraceae bacterium]